MWVAGGTGTHVDGTASAKAQRQVHTHLFRDSKGPVRLRWSELGASGKPGSQQGPDLGGPRRPVKGLWLLV